MINIFEKPLRGMDFFEKSVSYRFLLLAVFFMLFTFRFMSQENNRLVIRNVNTGKGADINHGEVLSLTCEKKEIHGFLYHLSKDSIFLDSVGVALSNVKEVTLHNSRGFMRRAAPNFVVAGLVYLTISTLNLVLNEKAIYFPSEHVVPSISLISFGAICERLKDKHYRLKGKWNLIIIPM